MEPVTSITVNVYNLWLLSVVVGIGLMCGVFLMLAVADLVSLIYKGVQRVVDYVLPSRPKPR
jgi:hypothetical protein